MIPRTEHAIKLKKEVLVCFKPYTIANAVVPEFKSEIYRLLNANIIRNSSSEFASPCFPIRKSSGEIRIVVEFKALNAATLPDPFSLPWIEELILELKGTAVFSKLDMRNDYHQIAIRAADTHKTGFVTPWGHYKFLQLPFGLATAPCTISRIFEKTFGLLTFLYDLLILQKQLQNTCRNSRKFLN